ncbi:MAG: hypothetical protein EB047_08450 [Chitinophagaceae bacterium]|jgi:hypothetical protein|nr:hypothetical protein [Chitinophagaceae bacterium]
MRSITQRWCFVALVCGLNSLACLALFKWAGIAPGLTWASFVMYLLNFLSRLQIFVGGAIVIRSAWV